jgi:hypothetical protein
VLDTIHYFHADSVKIYFGTLESAKRVARFDKQQAELKRVISHTGKILFVRDLRFTIEFMDGSIVSNRELDDDLRSTAAFQAYAREHAFLERFIYTGQERTAFLKATAAQPLPEHIKDKDPCFIDMHCFNRETSWYDELDLPEQPVKTYFAKANFIKFDRLHKGKYYKWDVKLNVSDHLIGVTPEWFHDFVKFDLPAYGIAIDKDLIKAHPQLTQG